MNLIKVNHLILLLVSVSKACVCGLSPAENVGSNPIGGVDVFLF